MMAQPNGVRPVATPHRDRTTEAKIANIQDIPCLTTGASGEEEALQKDVELIQACCSRLLGKLESADDQSQKYAEMEKENSDMARKLATFRVQVQDLLQQLEVSNKQHWELEKELVDEKEKAQKDKERALSLEA